VEPFEIMAAPYDIYLAPEGTAKPDIGIDPAGPWALLGRRGADNYDEAGVVVTHEQSINQHRGLRGTGPVKAWRTSENLMLGFTLDDMRPEALKVAVNGNDVTDGGSSSTLPLHQGAEITTYALLARSSQGPNGDDLASQYYVPKCYQSASPAVTHAKGKAAGIPLAFTAIEDLDAATEEERFGVFEAEESGS
jgi:hypothetical protein